MNFNWLLITVLWLISIICIVVMKRIQPKAWVAYTSYVLAVVVAVTIFAALRLYRG